MLKSASTPVRAAHSKLSFEPISQQIRNKIGNAHLRSPTTQEPAGAALVLEQMRLLDTHLLNKKSRRLIWQSKFYPTKLKIFNSSKP